jgi:hypothetical protein
VVKARKQERFNKLRFIGSHNDSAWEDILLLVALVSGMLDNDPDIHPAVQGFAFVQLCTINRYDE